APFNDLRGLVPAGNITTSVADLARFAMLQLRGGPAGGAQILSGRTLAEMHRVHWLEPDWQAGRGLGLRGPRLRGHTSRGPPWAGGARGGARRRGRRRRPADKTEVTASVNAEAGEAGQYGDRAFEWVGGAIAKLTQPAPPTADPAWARYVGRYRNAWGDVQI